MTPGNDYHLNYASSATVAIADNDAALTLTIDSATISENGGTAQATVTRNTGTSGDLTVDRGNCSVNRDNSRWSVFPDFYHLWPRCGDDIFAMDLG